MKQVRESDPEGLGPDIIVKTTMDEHRGHEVEASETLYDNRIEYTRWGHCLTCSHYDQQGEWVAVEVMIRSVSVADWDEFIS